MRFLEGGGRAARRERGTHTGAQRERRFGSNGRGARRKHEGIEAAGPRAAERALQVAAGLDVTHIPYRAGSEGLRDLMAARLSHQFDVAVTAIPQVQSGALKALAVTSRSRLASLPDVPTVIEAGIKDFEGSTWNSIAAPAGTPQTTAEKINRDVAAALAQPAIRGVRILVDLVGEGAEFH